MSEAVPKENPVRDARPPVLQGVFLGKLLPLPVTEPSLRGYFCDDVQAGQGDLQELVGILVNLLGRTPGSPI